MFEKAVEANPSDLLAHAHAAYALFDAGEYEAAEAHLSKALAIDSLDPQPHFYLAIFFWESGMFRESLVEWEKVVRMRPGKRPRGEGEGEYRDPSAGPPRARGGGRSAAPAVRRTRVLTGMSRLP